MKKENGRPRMIMLEGPMDIASVFEWFAEESKSIAEQAIEPAQREKFAKLDGGIHFSDIVAPP
jgi:hypothetical protein